LRILPEQNAPRYFALTEQPIGRQADSIEVDVLELVSSVSIDTPKKVLSENKRSYYFQQQKKNNKKDIELLFNLLHLRLVSLSYNDITIDHLE
jgi:hypothetical protein